MKVIKISPCGFCQGVAFAYNKVKEISKNNHGLNIYLIGWLVHNRNVIDELNKLNINVLNDRNSSRIDLVQSIKNKSIIIFSAHGTDKKAIELARQNGHIVYDLTCKYVNETLKIIQDSINQNKKVIYIGKSNHPETIAAVSIDKKNINIVEKYEDLKKINFKLNEQIVILNQSTINLENYQNLINKIKNKYKNVELKTEICKTTTTRQQSIKNNIKNIDVLIVVGDKRSNNSNELLKIGLLNDIDSYLINSKTEIDKKWFINKNIVGVAAGASTPNNIVNDVIKYLKDEYLC